jgi:pimeloyl-ACP methyl ester carboxylesterase
MNKTIRKRVKRTPLRCALLTGITALTLAACGQSEQPQAPEASAAAEPTEMASTPETTEAPTSSDPSELLPGIEFLTVESNGIQMRVASMGEGPVVLFAHGWPESWYSWRHQIKAVADAGFRALAPDMRGYGKTDAPEDVTSYNQVNLAADMVGILDALNIDSATMVGHDWGAPVATHSVLLYPERFNSLVLMNVPHGGRGPGNPMDAMRERTGDNFFYMVYHNEPGGVAEAEYDSDPRGFLSRIYLSPDSPREPPEVTDPKRAAGGWIPRLGAAKGLPDWLAQADLDYYVSQFEAAGFRGGVNYYRNFGLSWELTAELDQTVRVPALFIAGDKDLVIGGASAEQLRGMMASTVPQLTDVVLIPGIGHWVQQEAPMETNAALLAFLKER